ncbi:24802_t:CDS:2, partial [Gigaspora rosea]
IMIGKSPYHNIPYDINLAIRIYNGLRPELPRCKPESQLVQMMTQYLRIEINTATSANTTIDKTAISTSIKEEYSVNNSI